jgi:hypothetical protein
MQRRNELRIAAKELAALGFGEIVFVFHGSVSAVLTHPRKSVGCED